MWLHNFDLSFYGSAVWRNGSSEKRNYVFRNFSLGATDSSPTLKRTLGLNSSTLFNVSGNATLKTMPRFERSFWCPVFSKTNLLGLNCSSRLFGVCKMRTKGGKGRGKKGRGCRREDTTIYSRRDGVVKQKTGGLMKTRNTMRRTDVAGQ